MIQMDLYKKRIRQHTRWEPNKETILFKDIMNTSHLLINIILMFPKQKTNHLHGVLEQERDHR